MISRRSLARRGVLALAGLVFCPALQAEDPRVVVFLRSADALNADLRHLCVDLAGKPQEWENNVWPNIDVFLFGVDTRQRPIRHDRLIGGATGSREQMMIPIDDLKQFINVNLIPFGFVVTQDKQDKRLYSIAGAGFAGWMRIVAGYAVFAEANHLADIPRNMPAPDDSHSELMKQGYDFAVRVDNSRTTVNQRTAAFAAYRKHALAAIQQRPNETPEALALRTLNGRHSLESMERVFVESSMLSLGLTIDSSRDIATSRFVLSALPGTHLAETFQRQARQSSRFAGVRHPDDAVLAGRLNSAFSATTARPFAEFYRATRTPLEQQIDRIEGLTDDQRQARKQIVQLLLEILTTSLDLHKWDGLAQITSHADGRHSGLLALGIKDAASVASILDLLPDASNCFKTDLNVDSAGDVTIHKLTIAANYPQALQDFFGPSGELYIGVGHDSVWLSIGDRALESLRSGVDAASSALVSNIDQSVAVLDVHILPILQLQDRLQKDCDFDLLGILVGGALVDDDSPSLFDDFEWRSLAIEALRGEDDRLHFDLQHVDDRLEGNASVESGILKAIGDVIAEFAKQKLG